MRLRERIRYMVIFLAIVVIEVLIALYMHDKFIRPYVGDVLVVFAVYYFVRIFVPKWQRLLPLYVFIFALVVECLQAINIAKILGVDNNPVLRVLTGTVFDWKDIVCYAVGCTIIMIYEMIIHSKS